MNFIKFQLGPSIFCFFNCSIVTLLFSVAEIIIRRIRELLHIPQQVNPGTEWLSEIPIYFIEGMIAGYISIIITAIVFRLKAKLKFVSLFVGGFFLLTNILVEIENFYFTSTFLPQTRGVLTLAIGICFGLHFSVKLFAETKSDTNVG